MSHSSHSSSQARDKILQTLLPLLWDQWSSIGVSGYADEKPEYLIDPEALLLCSSEYARYDARLFEQITDWLMLNGKSINIQRLLNIRKNYPLGNAAVMRAIASKLSNSSSKFSKWTKVITHNSFASAREDENPVSLFYSHSSLQPEIEKQPDMDFYAQGLISVPLKQRKLSQTVNTIEDANLIFKLRNLFGCNSRADILAWLLTHRSGHPAQIAKDIHFFNKSVQSTLNEMSASGMILYHRSEREKHFTLHHDLWNNFLSFRKLEWRNWVTLFTTISLFEQTLAEAAKSNASEMITALMLLEIYKNHSYVRLFVHFSHIDPANYVEYITDQLCAALNPSKAFS